MKNRLQGFAIVRVDEFLDAVVACRERITVKEIVWTRQAAESEVARLNALNANKGAEYFWQTTRVEPVGWLDGHGGSETMSLEAESEPAD